MLWFALFLAPFLVRSTWAYKAPESPQNDVVFKTQIDTPEAVIAWYGSLYGFTDEMTREAIEIARCESGLNPEAVNIHDSEKGSWGLVQINLSAHPEITREMALNKYYASWFLISEIKAGRMWKWSCAKSLGYL